MAAPWGVEHDEEAVVRLPEGGERRRAEMPHVAVVPLPFRLRRNVDRTQADLRATRRRRGPARANKHAKYSHLQRADN